MASVEAVYFSTIHDRNNAPYSMVFTENGQKLSFNAARLGENVTFTGDEDVRTLDDLKTGHHVRVEYKEVKNPNSPQIAPEIVVYSITLVREIASV